MVRLPEEEIEKEDKTRNPKTCVQTRGDIKQQSCQTETWKAQQQSNQADGNGDVQMDDGIFKMLCKKSDFFVSRLTA